MGTAFHYYNCNKCYFRTTLLSRINVHLQIHVDTKHSPISHFNCFDRLKPLKCTSCNFSTKSLIVLKYHLVHNHDKQQFTLKAKLKKCKMCKFQTHSKYLWIRHPIFSTCKCNKRSNEKRVPVKKDGKWLLCVKCDYRTLKICSVKNHFICKHTPLEEIKWHHCKKCPSKFKTLDSLNVHERRVHMPAMNRLHCAKCDYSTPSRFHLSKHFNRRHTRPEEISWVECHHCSAKFKDKEGLKSHMKRHTTGEKPFKCDQCPYKTYRKNNFNSHINRHPKEKVQWLECQHCDFKTKQKLLINQHIKNMHPESIDMVQCPHCDFKSRYNSCLQKHIARFHDDSVFKCDLCDYKAKYENMIEIHKKNKHEVDNSDWLKCEHCDYRSKYRQVLRHHIIAKHDTDREVFQCKKCEYKAFLKHYVTNHTRRMHKRSKPVS